MKKTINNLNEMKNFAKEISVMLKPKDVLCLSGQLGAGKTTFTQFLLKELGVNDVVTSPTFTIVKTYESKLGILNHIDAYRLEGVKNKEMFDDYLYHDGLTIIEWPEFLEINKNTKKITLKFTGENKREAILDGFNI